METDLTEKIEQARKGERLLDKVTVITGVEGGQGRTAALLFAAAGALVIGSDIAPSGIEATSKLAADYGLSLDLNVVDAADWQSVTCWIDGKVDNYGGIDTLYSNAAYAYFAPIKEMSLEQWHNTMRLQLDIVFVPTRVAWRHLVARGGGCILNIASVSGMRGTGLIGASDLAAGKGGVIGLTHQLALEGAPHGIRANTISPGPIMTPAALAYMDREPAFKARFGQWPLLNRVGKPEDIAYAAMFLASDEAAFITGTNLVVDGGWTCKGGITIHPPCVS